MQVNLKTMQALAKFIAPKADVRYYLNGVLLEVTDKGRYYVATCGHKLVAIRESRQEDDIEGQYILPRDVILGIKLQKAGRNPIECAEFNPGTDGKASITYCGTETRFGLVDGKFPDWRRVVPTKVSGEVAQFNPDYLVALRDCASASVGIGKLTSLFVSHNGNGPALAQCASGDWIAVIMPARTSSEDATLPGPNLLHLLWGFPAPAPEPMAAAA